MLNKRLYWALARHQTTANFWRFSVMSKYNIREASGHYFGLTPLYYVFVGLGKYSKYVDDVLGMTSYRSPHD